MPIGAPSCFCRAPGLSLRNSTRVIRTSSMAYLPIEDYGLISNNHTAPLLG